MKKRKKSVRNFSRKIRTLRGFPFPRKKRLQLGYFNLLCKLSKLQSPLKVNRKKRKIKRRAVSVVMYNRNFSGRKVLLKKMHREKLNAIIYQLRKKKTHKFKGRKRILSILRGISKTTPNLGKISKTIRIILHKNRVGLNKFSLKRKSDFSFTHYSNAKKANRVLNIRQHLRKNKIYRSSLFKLAYKLDKGEDNTRKLYYKIPNIFWKNFRKKIRRIAPIYDLRDKRYSWKVFFWKAQSKKNRNKRSLKKHKKHRLDPVRKELKEIKHYKI